MSPQPRKKGRVEIWIVTNGREEKHVALVESQAVAFARRYNAHISNDRERVRVEQVIAYYGDR
jgi:hypothetical protein